LHKNKLFRIEEVILCANKAKNITIVELFFRLAALKSLDVAPAIPAFFALPAEKIAASYFHKSHVVRLYFYAIPKPDYAWVLRHEKPNCPPCEIPQVKLRFILQGGQFGR